MKQRKSETKQAATSLVKLDHHRLQPALKHALVIPQTRSGKPLLLLPFEVPIPREVQDQADMSSLHPLVYCFGLADTSWLTAFAATWGPGTHMDDLRTSQALALFCPTSVCSEQRKLCCNCRSRALL